MLSPVAIILRTLERLEFEVEDILCRFSQKFITGHFFRAVSSWKIFRFPHSILTNFFSS
jgi:hypothetical protein